MAERIGSSKITRENGFLYYVGSDGYAYKAPMKSNPRGRKGRVTDERIKREAGYLYFVDKAGYVARAKMNRRGRR